MSRFFLGCLSLCALALMIGQATADSNNAANNPADNNGVLIIETYTASSQPIASNNADMQPLAGDKGVEVAPNNAVTNGEPVMVEQEEMMIEQTEQGE